MTENIQVRSPYSGKVIREVALQDETTVFKIMGKSHTLYLDRKNWLSKVKRIEILNKLVHKMSAKKEELAALAASEGGKPLKDSIVEVDRAIQGVSIAIGELSRQKGEMIPMGSTVSSENRIAYTIKEPGGVVIAVSAFNHPLNLIVHQVIPAVAVNAPVIIKPAKATPLSCLKLVELLYESGLPKDWCRVIICDNQITERLIKDPRNQFLSFIGSARVGWHLRSILPPGAHCALEHGGVAPVIVEKDVDMAEMIPALLKGGFYHAGQVCVSVQRIYAHEKIVDELVKQMVKGTKELIVGDPLDAKTDVGPLISPSEVDRVESWVNNAKEKKATILCGGKKIHDYLFEPTLILNPPEDCEISTREVFGPVIAIYSYTSRQEAIQKANAVPFSFQAAVFTKNLDVALDTVSQLKANAVMVNDHTAFRVDWMPFGGSENAGLGLGGIPYSMEDMTKEKLVIVKSQSL